MKKIRHARISNSHGPRSAVHSAVLARSSSPFADPPSKLCSGHLFGKVGFKLFTAMRLCDFRKIAATHPPRFLPFVFPTSLLSSTGTTLLFLPCWACLDDDGLMQTLQHGDLACALSSPHIPPVPDAAP